MARHVRRALADPGSEQAKDIWDLAIFGHPGGCRSPASPSRGCARPPRAGPLRNCPATAARGAAKVQAKVNALARLSESLRARADRGD